MARNSIRYIAIVLALSMALGGPAWASVETTVPAKSAAPVANSPDESSSDDESTDDKTGEEQAGFNTLEDMLLFRGPLATLWAAPQPETASVQWREVAPEDKPDSDGDNSKE